MKLYNDNPTKETIAVKSIDNAQMLLSFIKREIRSNFDSAMTLSEATSWVSIAEMYGYSQLAQEMSKDVLTELAIWEEEQV